MKLSLTVMAHGAVVDVFKRHIPLWEAIPTQGPKLVLSPENDPLESHQWKSMSIGNASHAGPQALLRLRWLMAYLSFQSSCTHHLIFEYDSFCTAMPKEPKNGLSGILFWNKEPDRFLAPFYPNPPWLLDHASVVGMDRASLLNPGVTEGGFADRWLAAIANCAGLCVRRYDPDGFSRGTITESDYPTLEQAKNRGATMFHGVKDKRALDFILK